MAVPALRRLSLRTCSSKMVRRSSILTLWTSSACEADTAVSKRSAESRALSASSPEKGSWCAQRLRTSISSLTRTAFGFAQDAAEDVAPAPVHHDEHDADVLQGVALAIAKARVIERFALDLHSPVVTVPGS